MQPWVQPLLVGIMQTHLGETSVDTQVLGREHADLGGMSERAQVNSIKVLGARCQIGDEKRFLSQRMHESSNGGRCPHGCRCQFTWFHAAFVCQASHYVSIRSEWYSGAAELTGWVERGGTVPHTGWQRFVARMGHGSGGLGLGWAGAVVAGTEDEKEMRRLACGGVEGVSRGEASV